MTARVEVRRGYFAPDELESFLEASRDKRERLGWMTMSDMGFRLKESLGLTIGEASGISVRLVGKGGRVRRVPTTSRVRKLAEELLQAGQVGGAEPIWKCGPRSVQHRFERALRRSGVPKKKLCVHSLRHTYATRCLTAGIDIHRVGVLLGHRSTLTTTGYLHHDERSLKEAADSLDRMEERRAAEAQTD